MYTFLSNTHCYLCFRVWRSKWLFCVKKYVFRYRVRLQDPLILYFSQKRLFFLYIPQSIGSKKTIYILILCICTIKKKFALGKFSCPEIARILMSSTLITGRKCIYIYTVCGRVCVVIICAWLIARTIFVRIYL